MKDNNLTPEEFLRKCATMPNKFEVSVLNFEVQVGADVRDVFRKSFFLHRFNAPQAPAWKPRKDNKPHDLLLETGTLRDSIIWKQFSNSKKHGVNIYTDPKVFKNSNRQVVKHVHRNFCYAHIHNFGNKNEKTGAITPARQFMGHSYRVWQVFENNEKILLEGLS